MSSQYLVFTVSNTLQDYKMKANHSILSSNYWLYSYLLLTHRYLIIIMMNQLSYKCVLNRNAYNCHYCTYIYYRFIKKCMHLIITIYTIYENTYCFHNIENFSRSRSLKLTYLKNSELLAVNVDYKIFFILQLFLNLQSHLNEII